METLVKIGAAGATPFVLQFLMDFIMNGNTQQISLRTKMLLSVAVGAILGLLIPLYESTRPDLYMDFILPANGLQWFFTILDGGFMLSSSCRYSTT